mmetsp:Transcript_46608/g.123708  ORF Transcript_46608/g.123708 Transcript_46608/m.123708 type:complete len:107 (-) Transcript_46608:219-539(-)|eukprot:CAMPEP_0194482510 /NCGR_PEP_ID=MMETSP0253-20130528/4429_1 /TAXON_ID=2966 /ORGANISM="Noctiluca scintillans" /LENGTH=106 /DNA_ID=CAMNT_0039322051 /DNA_START=59 /DNA_END=379 /DNA_ORIENTATION=+
MDSGKVPQYQTIKRLQKNYLVRCNDELKDIIPGTGIKPASLVNRKSRELAQKRKDLGLLVEQELMSQMDTESQNRAKTAQEFAGRKHDLTESIKNLEKELSDLELL